VTLAELHRRVLTVAILSCVGAIFMLIGLALYNPAPPLPQPQPLTLVLGSSDPALRISEVWLSIDQKEAHRYRYRVVLRLASGEEGSGKEGSRLVVYAYGSDQSRTSCISSNCTPPSSDDSSAVFVADSPVFNGRSIGPSYGALVGEGWLDGPSMVTSNDTDTLVAMPNLLINKNQLAFDDRWVLTVDAPVPTSSTLSWQTNAEPKYGPRRGSRTWTFLESSRELSSQVVSGSDPIQVTRKNTELLIAGALIALAGSAILAIVPDLVAIGADYIDRRRKRRQLSFVVFNSEEPDRLTEALSDKRPRRLGQWAVALTVLAMIRYLLRRGA
jgi:hypothetical protein